MMKGFNSLKLNHYDDFDKCINDMEMLRTKFKPLLFKSNFKTLN